MPLRKLLATAAVAATVAGVGLTAVPAAHAAEASSASTVRPLGWIPWGTYADLAQCHHAGQWAVQNAGASNYTCSQTAPGQYALYIYRV
ncbi:hypothetical protein [Streptomyces flavofungini]|uniref:Uncharacterized protein n=1 Tax=Streptomyces flavofungini TaxID=68200 RepID=A0ABS0X7Z4_9ACTN|nr:hypothetical protein [Streptomyces flavofungini]MBJ3809325.1 hypothetical protein [Streptomyces flavofungini]GHC77597.1 hypothetical protein GCM10010349_58360 [Streptomyces flavofungini]